METKQKGETEQDTSLFNKEKKAATSTPFLQMQGLKDNYEQKTPNSAKVVTVRGQIIVWTLDSTHLCKNAI